jgi:hypothetical protein
VRAARVRVRACVRACVRADGHLPSNRRITAARRRDHSGESRRRAGTEGGEQPCGKAPVRGGQSGGEIGPGGGRTAGPSGVGEGGESDVGAGGRQHAGVCAAAGWLMSDRIEVWVVGRGFRVLVEGRTRTLVLACCTKIISAGMM